MWLILKGVVGWLKIPLIIFVLLGTVLSVPYFFFSSEVRQAVEVPTPQATVSEKSGKRVPVAESESAEVKELRSKVEDIQRKLGSATQGVKTAVKGFDISSWVPDLTPRTWLILMLFIAAGILAYAKKLVRAAIAFAAGAALLTFPAITVEGFADGTWLGWLQEKAEELRSSSADWKTQTWAAIILAAAAIVLHASKKKAWAVATALTAGLLFISPPINADLRDKLQGLTVGITNPLPTDCDEKKGPLLTLTDKDLPFPNCKFHAELYEGTLQFKDNAGETVKIAAGEEKPRWPKGFEAILVRGVPSAKVEFTFRPK